MQLESARRTRLHGILVSRIISSTSCRPSRLRIEGMMREVARLQDEKVHLFHKNQLRAARSRPWITKGLVTNLRLRGV
jgi:hypothetical protein